MDLKKYIEYKLENIKILQKEYIIMVKELKENKDDNALNIPPALIKLCWLTKILKREHSRLTNRRIKSLLKMNTKEIENIY